MGTIDAHLLALDAKSGQLLWNTTVASSAQRYSITHAPLVVKDKVIVGTAGGDMGIRGIVAAFDAKTGKEVWRFHTIPGPGEPGNETLVGRLVEDRRRRRLERGRLRSRDEPDVLRHRQPGARLGRPRRGSATTSTATASSRSTPTPAS